MNTYQARAEAIEKAQKRASLALWIVLAFMLTCLGGLVWAVLGQLEALIGLLKATGRI